MNRHSLEIVFCMGEKQITLNNVQEIRDMTDSIDGKIISIEPKNIPKMGIFPNHSYQICLDNATYIVPGTSFQYIYVSDVKALKSVKSLAD